MSGRDSDAADILNALIETCRDGEEGFRHASEAVEDPSLARLLLSYSQQQAEFGRTLKEELVHLGRVPVESGQATGWIRRGWIDLGAGVPRNEEAAIVMECERGEEAAVRAFGEAVEGPLPGSTRRIVERQFQQLQEAHEHIRSLEQNWAHTD
jgi:uncharacterized protein (TIGR02284 family)